MNELFTAIALKSSRLTTKSYSTSFSLGIIFLNKKFRDAIYAIYGFVRFADEIVDSFHEFDRTELLQRFKDETKLAIQQKISLNPIVHSLQYVVNKYKIDNSLIDAFFYSMEMDLTRTNYDISSYKEYIYGSAEVVGLMCLRVFCEDNDHLFNELNQYAIKLGSAYQKVNFLRDMSADYKKLGRIYFPGETYDIFNQESKHKIIQDIYRDFNYSVEGIKKLPSSSKLGVYLSYIYYLRLLKKIKKMPVGFLKQNRIRITNFQKGLITLFYCLKYYISGI